MPRCTLFPTRPINLQKNWKELAHRGALYLTTLYFTYFSDDKVHNPLSPFCQNLFFSIKFSHEQMLEHECIESHSCSTETFEPPRARKMKTVPIFGILLVRNSVHSSFPTLLYLFAAQLSFCTVFYSSPRFSLYGAIGKYTTSHLIVSQWRGAISSVWSILQCLQNPTTATGKQSSLWPSHLSDALPVTALRHITCVALDVEVLDLFCVRHLEGLCVRRGGGCKVKCGVTNSFIISL